MSILSYSIITAAIHTKQTAHSALDFCVIDPLINTFPIAFDVIYLEYFLQLLKKSKCCDRFRDTTKLFGLTSN